MTLQQYIRVLASVQVPGSSTLPESQKPLVGPQNAKKPGSMKALPVQEFIQGRFNGAEEIAESARQKGGLSALTAIHFEAKLPAYKLSLRLSKQFQGRDLWAHLHALAAKINLQLQKQDLPMERFQSLTGQLEVYGEIATYLENPTAL